MSTHRPRPASSRKSEVPQEDEDEFTEYARTYLNIRPKTGQLVSLHLDGVQKLLHARAEAQLEKTGRVRMLVLKARQPGISTKSRRAPSPTTMR